MKRRYKLAISAAFVASLLIAIWLACGGGAGQGGLHVGFAGARGHFPEPGLVYGDQIMVLWVTNARHSAITLDAPYVQFEDKGGRVVTDHGSSWNQEGYSVELSPGSAAWLANGFDPDSKRLRYVLEYHRRGGALLTFMSKAFGALPVPQRTHDFLRRHGMVDGNLYAHYESPWIANETVQRTGASRSAQETNQTSTAADSSR